MTFGQAIASGFQNYVNFSGRAARSAYWYWALFAVLVSIATYFIDSMIPGHGNGADQYVGRSRAAAARDRGRSAQAARYRPYRLVVPGGLHRNRAHPAD